MDVREKMMPARTRYYHTEIILHQTIRGNMLSFLPNFEAFVMMARSVTTVLQKSMKHVDGFGVWYEKRQNLMRQDSVCRYFFDMRNVVAHAEIIPYPKIFKFANPETKQLPIIYPIKTGEQPITIVNFSLKNLELTQSILEQYDKKNERYRLAENDSIDIVHLSCAYMEKLLELLNECVQRFTSYKNLYELQNSS